MRRGHFFREQLADGRLPEVDRVSVQTCLMSQTPHPDLRGNFWACFYSSSRSCALTPSTSFRCQSGQKVLQAGSDTSDRICGELKLVYLRFPAICQEAVRRLKSETWRRRSGLWLRLWDLQLSPAGSSVGRFRPDKSAQAQLGALQQARSDLGAAACRPESVCVTPVSCRYILNKQLMLTAGDSGGSASCIFSFFSDR